MAGEVLSSLRTGKEEAQHFAYLCEHEKKSSTLSVKRKGLLLSENMQLCVANSWGAISMHWDSEITNLV